ncbi:MAG: AAA family ATPase [Clostridia bacterium]|nr:AAA family ATPase [Clostridia bacterium]
MSIIAVISGKGGVGKTTVAINVACALKTLGNKTLLIDCGFGVRNADVALGRTTQSVCNIRDLILGNASVEETIIAGDEEYMPDFIAASANDIPNNFAVVFKSVISELSSKYDYIIIDTPASSGVEFSIATYVSDTVLAITTENVFSVSNVSLCLNRIDETKNKYIVLNRCNFSSDQTSICAEDIADEIGAMIIGLVRDDEYVDNSLINADPIVRYDTYAGRDLENISRRLAGIQPLVDKKNKLFERNKLVLKSS